MNMESFGRRLRLLLASTLVLLVACQGKHPATAETERPAATLDQQSVEAFADYLEEALLANNPAPFNEAFDKEHIRRQISDNSIVLSALDSDFGLAFFESNFRQGDKAIETIEQGGEARFVKYYEQEGKHHLIFRLYRDHALQIEDYVIDTVDGKLKIKEGFSYLSSSSLVDQIRSHVLYDVMNRTLPDGPTRYLEQVRDLLRERKGAEALEILEAHRQPLSEYKLYIPYYLQGLMQKNPQKYLAALAEMDGRELDHRSVLLHSFLYYVNTGDVENAESATNALIHYTGDDPIYLFLFGLSHFYHGDYASALYCHENALTGMRMIWDIWYNELACYAKLDDPANFKRVLSLGTELYGLNEQELADIAGDFRLSPTGERNSWQ